MGSLEPEVHEPDALDTVTLTTNTIKPEVTDTKDAQLQHMLSDADAILQSDPDIPSGCFMPQRAPVWRHNFSTRGVRTGPTQILPYLYIGDASDAMCVGQLTELSVTHALNCAGSERRSFFDQFPRVCRNNNPITCKQIDADDSETYDIVAHFEYAFGYIDHVTKCGGKVLVYCRQGVNRSVAICVGYLVGREGFGFLKAVRLVREKRGRVLTNKGFLKQLAEFAQKLKEQTDS